MLHNFSILFRIDMTPQYFHTQAKCLDDAMINLYDVHEDAIYLDNDIDINPALFEPETDTIKAAIESRNK